MVGQSSLGTQRSLGRPGGKKWWRLDTQRVLVILFLIALFAMSAREIVDPDFWWHLATGRYIVETGDWQDLELEPVPQERRQLLVDEGLDLEGVVQHPRAHASGLGRAAGGRLVGCFPDCVQQAHE